MRRRPSTRRRRRQLRRRRRRCRRRRRRHCRRFRATQTRSSAIRASTQISPRCVSFGRSSSSRSSASFQYHNSRARSKRRQQPTRCRRRRHRHRRLHRRRHFQTSQARRPRAPIRTRRQLSCASLTRSRNIRSLACGAKAFRWLRALQVAATAFRSSTPDATFDCHGFSFNTSAPTSCDFYDATMSFVRASNARFLFCRPLQSVRAPILGCNRAARRRRQRAAAVDVALLGTRVFAAAAGLR